MIERQVIVTWYTPEEKLPPEHYQVVVTVSGTDGYVTYEHALMLATYAEDGLGWLIDGCSDDVDLTVEAWADLDPYGWKERQHDS